MHIPDGLLHPAVIATAGVVSAGGLSLALKKTRDSLDDTTVPTVGIMAAFLFVAQMLQFPAGPGVSGHLLGGALSAILLGPWTASLVLGTVLIIQCFVFQDGGLLALGANIFNMAFVGVFSAYMCYVFLKTLFPAERAGGIAVFIATFVSVIMASAAAGIELGVSGVFQMKAGFLMIVGVHIPIGIAEALITFLVVSFVLKTCPEYFTFLRKKPV